MSIFSADKRSLCREDAAPCRQARSRRTQRRRVGNSVSRAGPVRVPLGRAALHRSLRSRAHRLRGTEALWSPKGEHGYRRSFARTERYTKSRPFEERRGGPSPHSAKPRKGSGLSAIRTA